MTTPTYRYVIKGREMKISYDYYVGTDIAKALLKFADTHRWPSERVFMFNAESQLLPPDDLPAIAVGDTVVTLALALCEGRGFSRWYEIAINKYIVYGIDVNGDVEYVDKEGLVCTLAKRRVVAVVSPKYTRRPVEPK